MIVIVIPIAYETYRSRDDINRLVCQEWTDHRVFGYYISKHIFFRGKLYYIFPPDLITQWQRTFIMTYRPGVSQSDIRVKKTDKHVKLIYSVNGIDYLDTQQVKKIDIYSAHRCPWARFGHKKYYDPRKFGRCAPTMQSAEYQVHEIGRDNYCLECERHFPNLIPQMIGGRLIRYMQIII